MYGSGKWESGIEKVLAIIESVDTVLGSAASGAKLTADIVSSTCARDASVSLIGVDIFRPIEDAAPFLLTFARNFKVRGSNHNNAANAIFTFENTYPTFI